MKKIWLFLIIFLLCGCDVIYDLEITDSSFKESTNFKSKSLNESQEFDNYYLKQDYLSKSDALQKEFYNKKSLDGEFTGLNLSYDFDYKNYNLSSMLNYCYGKDFVKIDSKYIIIDGVDGNQCFIPDMYNKINSITIRIKSKLKSVGNNADEIKGNTYIWKFTRENASKKDIYLKLRKSSNAFSIIWILLVGIILIIIVAVNSYYFIKKKNSESNEI